MEGDHTGDGGAFEPVEAAGHDAWAFAACRDPKFTEMADVLTIANSQAIVRVLWL